MNIARQAVLAAGFDETVPATTIDRQCGSSQQAAHFAAQGVIAGAYDIVIAGGVESMSRVPLGSSRAGGSRLARHRRALPRGPREPGRLGRAHRPQVGPRRARSSTPSRPSRTDGRRMPRPRVASTRSCCRSPTDDGVGRRPTRRCAPAPRSRDSPGSSPPSAPTSSPRASPTSTGTSPPGNSSPLTDAASAALIMSEEKAIELGLTPRARFHSFAVVGDDPLFMLTGPDPRDAAHPRAQRPVASTTSTRTR